MKFLKVFGIDGDKNLLDVFEVCFILVKYILCDIYMQDNIERKLKEFGVFKKEVNVYINEIFGKIVGVLKIKGLVDFMNLEEFDYKFESLKEEWILCYFKGLIFLKYFMEYKVDLIKNCMNVDL